MQDQWPLRNVFLLPRSPQLGGDTVRDKLWVLFKLFSFIRALLLWAFGKGCFYWCSLLLGLQCKQPASATIGIFFWTLFCLTLHSFSKGILVNLWNTKVWLLWNFNSVKYFFKTGDSKMKAEQAPLPTQTGFFCIFKCFCCWLLLELWKVFPVLEVWHKQGTVPFFFFKDEEFSKLLKAIKRKMKSKTRTILMLLILQWQCEKETGKKGESLSLCMYLEFVRFHIWRWLRWWGSFLGFFLLCFVFFVEDSDLQ